MPLNDFGIKLGLLDSDICYELHYAPVVIITYSIPSFRVVAL